MSFVVLLLVVPLFVVLLPVVAVNVLLLYFVMRVMYILCGCEEGKEFENREYRLPRFRDYVKYKLIPGVPDAKRIVRDMSSNIFYYTSDHYETFINMCWIHLAFVLSCLCTIIVCGLLYVII